MARPCTRSGGLSRVAGAVMAACFLVGCDAATGPEALTAAPRSAAALCSPAPIGEMPLQVRGMQAFVPLTVNHTTLRLLLDTGDFVTALTPETAARLDLPESFRPKLRMTGIGGAYSAPVVEASDVQYLSAHVTDIPFAVLPPSGQPAAPGVDGLFGANFLSAYDVELDFAAGRMRFYDQPAGCRGFGPGWAGPVTRLPAANAGRDLLLIPIRVNGTQFNALIDTGSEDTSITRRAALALGLDEASLARDSAITEYGIGETTMRQHRFASLSIGSAHFADPMLSVESGPGLLQSPAMLAALSALPTAHQDVDVILGANFLFKRRIWLAYHHGAVFIE